jgi:hypothetical protein
MENVGIFYDHLRYFTAILYNLWPFGIVCGHLEYFSHFGMFRPRKIWQPCLASEANRRSVSSDVCSAPEELSHPIQSTEQN